ncbi:alcohol dehydrogenase class IV [Bradyrhizobium sp. USDA 4350]
MQFAHAVEALYAPDANPLTSLMAEEGIAALARALPRIMTAPADPGARRDALYGAWLCAVCLGAVGMSLHHKLCHVLGGMFNLPHAETHAIVLPHAAAYNAAAAPEAMIRVARALHSANAPQGLFDLARQLALPRALSGIGMPEDGIAHAAEMAVRNPYANPRPVERAPIEQLIAAAWRGDAPVQH